MKVTRHSDGNIYPNLCGVFRRCFPIVTHQVERTGHSEVVRYYGEFYTISR